MALVPPTSQTRGYPIGLTGATDATRYVGGTTTGAPVTGTFAVGDFVIAEDAAVYVCTVAGSPGTWSAIGGGAPTTADYVTGSAQAGLSAELVLGTAVVMAGTHAARPAASLAGRVYFETDTLMLFRDTGAAWAQVSAGWPYVAMPPSGALGETVPRWAATQDGTTILSTGRLTLVPIWLPEGRVITNVRFNTGSVAINGPTHQIFGIFDDAAGTSSGTGYALLRSTVDDGATAWAADTAKSLALTATYTPTRSGFHNLGIMVTATVTHPSLMAGGVIGSRASVLAQAPTYGGTSTTGLTTALPNPAAAPSQIQPIAYGAVT